MREASSSVELGEDGSPKENVGWHRERGRRRDATMPVKDLTRHVWQVVARVEAQAVWKRQAHSHSTTGMQYRRSVHAPSSQQRLLPGQRPSAPLPSLPPLSPPLRPLEGSLYTISLSHDIKKQTHGMLQPATREESSKKAQRVQAEVSDSTPLRCSAASTSFVRLRGQTLAGARPTVRAITTPVALQTIREEDNRTSPPPTW